MNLENVYLKVIFSFQSEINSAFSFGLTLQFWIPKSFQIQYPGVESYGIEEINELVNFYGADKKSRFR